MIPDEAPVAAQYVVTFLKPEMLHVYRQITSLRAFRPVVFCQKRENAAQFPFEPIVILPKPRTHQIRRLFQKTVLDRPITIYRREARRILTALHAADARVLHIYFGHIGVHLLPLLEICDLPIIVSFHGADAQVDLDKPAHLAATQRLLALATLLLVRSQSIAERLHELGADPKKIRLHRTGIPLDEIIFTPRQPPADGAWHCLQACRLIAKKGLTTSLRAFARFTQTYPRATFTIAGEGPLLPELRALAAALGIDDRVDFAGFVSQERLRQLYATSHLFLHPSQLGPDGDQEGVPNSLLEAMASGLPILATRHGGIPEAVTDGETGALVAERDHVALAQAMLELAADPRDYAAMHLSASATVRANFSLEAQALLLGEYYSEAISKFPNQDSAARPGTGDQVT
jgi:colanic acid/amylovoran biosynthesis glycosyltransferase